jgi:hypothetical protein
MRRTLGCLTSLALIAATAPSTALAGGVFFGFGGAGGDVDFDSTFAENRVAVDDTLVSEWQVGYRFDSKLVIEGGGSFGMSLDTFFFGDAFTLADYHAMVGYAFQPTERFSIVPKLGLSHWRLDTQDFPGIFSLGGLSVASDEAGNDWIFRLSAEWRVAKRLHLYGAYTELHYDFGESTAPSLGFKFQF